MNVLDLYYGLWAQMLHWPVLKRAALILGIASLIIYVFFMPLFMKALPVILGLFNGIIKAVYCGIIAIAEGIMKEKSQTERATVLNQISAITEKFSQMIGALSEKAKKKKRIKPLKMILIYGAIILLIGLPDFLGNAIEAPYLPAVSAVSRLYQRMEEGVLVKAAEYPPLFRGKEKEAVSLEETARAEENNEDEVGELWLSLSSEGKTGAYMREGASGKSKKIKTLSGEAQVLYLGRQGNWVQVCLVTGEEGYVYVDLLEGVPEE